MNLIPPGFACCCADTRTPCPAPGRCGWWGELCCDTEEDVLRRDCWPATGWPFGPASYVVLDLDVIASMKACDFWRCTTGGTVPAVGLYDATVADCATSMPRATSGDEYAVAWHARKRLLRLVGVKLSWTPSDPMACTGWGFRARVKVNVAAPGTILAVGETDVFDECEQATTFYDCDLGTQQVECDLTFTPGYRGGWSLLVVPVSGTFPLPHDLPTNLWDGGSSTTAVGTGTARRLTTLDGYPDGGLLVSFEPSGCLWSWGEGSIEGRQVFGTASQSGTNASGTVPPCPTPEDCTYTASGAATSQLKAADIKWQVTRSLVGDALCGYDCDHLPFICGEPSSYAVTIETKYLTGMTCEGGCRQCAATCTTVGTLSWCVEDEQWVFEITGQDFTLDTGTANGCRHLDGGILVPIDDGCDGIIPEIEVSCQRDPEDLVAGPYGWAITGWEGSYTPTAAQLAFKPFSGGPGLTGEWEITSTGSWCPDGCGSPSSIDLYSRITIE